MADIGLGMDLTVVAGGQVITGVTISYAEYIRLLTERMSPALEERPGFQALGDVLQDTAQQAETTRQERQDRRDEMRKADASPEEIEDSPLEKPQETKFLHLKDAVIGSQADGHGHLLWRVSFDDISGWSLGRSLEQRADASR